MLPQDDRLTLLTIEEKRYPSHTHKILVDEERVNEIVDGLDAVKQAVYKQLNTERYEYEIYDPQYGIELKDLFGLSKVIVFPTLCHRIKDCLESDDRIESVDSFFYDRKNSHRGDLKVDFIVHSVFGDFELEEVFLIGTR